MPPAGIRRQVVQPPGIEPDARGVGGADAYLICTGRMRGAVAELTAALGPPGAPRPLLPPPPSPHLPSPSPAPSATSARHAVELAKAYSRGSQLSWTPITASSTGGKPLRAARASDSGGKATDGKSGVVWGGRHCTDVGGSAPRQDRLSRDGNKETGVPRMGQARHFCARAHSDSRRRPGGRSAGALGGSFCTKRG